LQLDDHSCFEYIAEELYVLPCMLQQVRLARDSEILEAAWSRAVLMVKSHLKPPGAAQAVSCSITAHGCSSFAHESDSTTAYEMVPPTLVQSCVRSKVCNFDTWVKVLGCYEMSSASEESTAAGVSANPGAHCYHACSQVSRPSSQGHQR